MNLKSLMLTVAIAGAMTVSAAEPQLLDIEMGAHHPVISPDGSTILYTALDHTGLKALSLEDGSITVIDQSAAAGFKPVFSADGSKIFYRTLTRIEGLVYRDIRSFDMTSLKGQQVAKPSRKQANLLSLSNDTYAYAESEKINVTLNGVTNMISPLEDAYIYQWASLSPDCSRLSFSEPFTGVYVANADGSNPVKLLPKGDFVSWVGPNTIMAVVSKDDGYQILSSRLVTVNVNTMMVRQITSDDFIVGEAAAAPCGTIVFTNLEGQMFMLNINDK